LWWNQDYGRLFIYYNDGTSNQWVDATLSPDISGIYGVANAANLVASAAFITANSSYASVNSNWTVTNTTYSVANSAYAVANAAYANANTKLANTTGTLAGALTTTGSITANGYLYVTPTDAGNEGGEIQLSGAGNYAGWALDAWQNNHRTFVRTGSTLANVTYFHATGGSLRMGVNKADPLYTLDVSGDVVGSSSVRAPIFYDSDNTGYYVDPNSTSNLYRLNVEGSSISGSGYTRLVNGTIIQWGSQTVGPDRSVDYNFPITFPSGCYGFGVSGDWQDANGWIAAGGRPISSSQYRLYNVLPGNIGVWWIAIGY
jgi:uncharacterized membrane protein